MSPIIKNIEWIFFDIGNVIFSDTIAVCYIYEAIFAEAKKQNPNLRFADLLSERERFILEERDGGHHRRVGAKFLGADGYQRLKPYFLAELSRNYALYHKVMPSAVDLIVNLASQYKIGVAANQVSGCRDVLGESGILEALSLVWLSEEVGFSKPDSQFFEKLLERLDCHPEQTVMIGDRIDADITPAKRLGMKTIHYCRRFSPPPESEVKATGLAYASEYFASAERVSIPEISPENDDEKPDRTVRDITEVPAMILSFNSNP